MSVRPRMTGGTYSAYPRARVQEGGHLKRKLLAAAITLDLYGHLWASGLDGVAVRLGLRGLWTTSGGIDGGQHWT